MSTARKAFYAAVGAGDLWLERVRTLPKRVTDLPTRIRRTDVGGLTTTARKRATKTYTDLSKRGEKLVKKVQRSAPTKRAIEQTKAARSRVKAAATSVRKAGKSGADAVTSAAERVVEQAG